ncbi:MAG: hypothetical protein R3335_02485, partial [Anaerolineales bacterium]|nr:hypothetical protein [Anaerolineales bacterium]
MTTWVNQKVMSKAVYDPFAKIYNEHWGSGFSERVFPLVQRLVLDLIQPGSWVLDLACGTG